MTIFWTIAVFLLVLTPIIIIHELGHFWVARFFKIRVDEFGIGFPPRAKTLFWRNGTRYSLNWIPIGGFVRPAGEDDPTVEGGLASSSPKARFFVLAAGATANFILGFFIFMFAFMLGRAKYDTNKVAIGKLFENGVAEITGLQLNDVFFSVNGKEVKGDSELLRGEVSTHVGQPIEVMIERNGQQIPFTMVPKPSEADPNIGVLGVQLTGYREGVERLGVLTAARQSLSTIKEVIVLTVQAPVMLLQKQLTLAEARPMSVVGISQVMGAEAEFATQTGDWFGFMFFAGLINIGLGFFNLLPLPALDGGRILFVLIEILRGKRISAERETAVHAVGMLLLLSLMMVMVLNDVINPITLR